MGSNTKLIEGRPDDSAQKIARRALKRRLERMWHYLERAVDEPGTDTENVHQLRVFARRTAAVIEIFEDCLPKRRGQWLRKQVNRVRKAAGEARDFDVLLMRWTQQVQQAPSDHAALLLEEVKNRRHEAQSPIEAVHKKLLGKRFVRRTKKLLKRVRQRGALTSCVERLGCMARLALARMVVPYLKSAQAELADAESLHAFRIQGKQVRYAMEIFAGAFDEAFRQELYPLVAMLQDRLGSINDHVTARTYFEQWRAEAEMCSVRQALELGIAEERQSFETSRQEFLAWWTCERRDDLCRRFARYVDLEAPDGPAPRREAPGE